ncbi:hypothetical protein [Baaleninema sp.]|uniref:hypothetical protein n=1 Tax=Baaleninema sp. TaxID=3101197 RepID=UPI003D02EEA8
MNHAQKLKELYLTAIALKNAQLKKLEGGLPEDIQKHIGTMAEKSLSSKAVYTVLVTLLIHKILNPEQDIRYHQEQLENGFSGRTIDTKYITPTLRNLELPAMAESGWLTRSLEQPYPYTLDYEGKIGNKKVKVAFLEIVNYVQTIDRDGADTILVLLLNQVKTISDRAKNIEILPLNNPERLDIDSLVESLSLHFNCKYGVRGASKLPVLAFYAIFSVLLQQLERYHGCTLKGLGSHTASDLKSKTAGDIEIFDVNGNLTEAIEIKHNKPIDTSVIAIAREKIYKFNPRRYCIFSYYDIDDRNIKNQTREIAVNHGCQVIVNGIIPTLKYYLRLISSLDDFVHRYSDLVQKFSSKRQRNSTHSQTKMAGNYWRLESTVNCDRTANFHLKSRLNLSSRLGNRASDSRDGGSR